MKSYCGAGNRYTFRLNNYEIKIHKKRFKIPVFRQWKICKLEFLKQKNEKAQKSIDIN